ncbi:uncharacterized protein NPIL_678281 [Nephila pilipes]|uniref:Uncharacterized protein n=1 Tax=Nephila pilipes TaxID=299642 RepID=A0A8X6PIU6_NEPPI|nr:uncharacterized protein NPIL_678281 [Nephila pilipes]
MAEGGNQLRERVVVREIDYRERLMNLMNEVDREIAHARPRPDFSQWIIQRKKTLRFLKELRKKLDGVSVSMSYGKGVGYGAAITGSVTSVAGVVMALGGLPAADIVMNAGRLINNSGSLVSNVSGAMESIFTTQYLQEIGSVLEKDKDLSRPFLEWMTFSNNLDANIQEIFGCSLSSLQLQNIANVFNEFLKLYQLNNNFQSTLDMLRSGKYSPYIGTDVQIKYLLRLFTELDTNKSIDFSKKLRITLTIFSNAICTYEVYRDGVELCKRLGGYEISTVVPTLRGGPELEIPSLRAVSAYCAFQTIDVAINFLSLLSAVRVIREGKSKYSDALTEIESLLKLELQSIEALS